MHPYIGVTGITSLKQAEKLLKSFSEPKSHRLMLGVLVSETTLVGKAQKENAKRYPDIRAVKDIFPDDPRALNLVHYCTFAADTLGVQLLELHKHVSRNCHGYQLNVMWPRAGEIWRFREMFPEKKIILQVGPEAQKKMDNDPIRIANKLKEYEKAVDGILFDVSGGRGIPLDPERALLHLFYFDRAVKSLSFGIAGGISAHTLARYESLVQKYPLLSLDGENAFRNAGTDEYLEKEAVAYVRGCRHLFRMRA